MSYSLSEYAEMHYYYGVAQGNGHLAARLYREQLERRGEEREHYPDHRVFINAHNTLMAGRVPGRSSHEGVPRVDLDVRDQVVEQVQNDPSTSTRTISRRTGIPRTSVMRILKSGYSDEEYETDPETKVKGPKPAKDGSEDSDGSFNPSGSEEADSDFDPEAGEPAVGARKRKSSSKPGRSSKGKKGKRGRPGKRLAKPTKGGRGKRAKSDSEEESEKSESDSEPESGSEGEDSDEPKSKRGRPPVVKGRKGQVAKPTPKATPVKRKAATPPAKKKPAPKGRPAAAKKGKKASSEEESGEGSEEESGDDDEESGDESDTPADKKAKRPPTDDEIKKYVKQILEGANLEQITMKTVCKQVYSHYPDFDLAHKKDFIKATVKSLIST